MRSTSEVVNTVKCAVCGTLKQKSNNWWMVVMGRERNQFRLTPMPNDKDYDKDAWYLCGEKCVGELVSEYMKDIRGAHSSGSDVASK